MHVVPLAACAEQPWKNGGGTTRELLTWPAAGEWALRLSVARIGQDGLFSAYPGVSRWFAVLSGGGVELTWDGRAAALLPGSPPVQFDGADAPQCRLLGAATEDLNLMLRQDRLRGALLPAHDGQDWQAAAGWRGVYTAGDCSLHTNANDSTGTSTHLAAQSLAWHDQAAAGAWRLQAHGPLRAWWIHIEGLTP
jgi:hypothetical protein